MIDEINLGKIGLVPVSVCAGHPTGRELEQALSRELHHVHEAARLRVASVALGLGTARCPRALLHGSSPVQRGDRAISKVFTLRSGRRMTGANQSRS